MKIISLLLLSTAFFSINCSKNAVDNLSNDSSNIYLKNTEIYEYPLGISGDEERVVIKKQPLHYKISEVVRNKDTNWEAVYIYRPMENYTGHDNVEIELRTGSDGASPPTQISVVKLDFLIIQ